MIKINLFPIKEIKKRYDIKLTIFVNVVCFIIILVIFGGLFYMNSVKLKNIESEISYNKHKLNELRMLRIKLKKFQKDKKILQTKFKIIKELESFKKAPSYIMYTFADNMPEKLWLKKFKEKGLSIQISGMTIDEPTIVQFINMLKKTKVFSKIELVQVSQVIISGYKFKSFSMNLEINKKNIKSIL